MPGEARLAHVQRVREVLHGGLRDTRQVLQYAQPGEAGEGLEMGAELAQRGRRCQRRTVHITKSLCIIAALGRGGLAPAARAGARSASSAGGRTLLREGA